MEQVHPIRDLFADSVHEALARHLRMNDEQVETYLTELLIRFMNKESLYAVRDAAGRPLVSVAEMLLEADVRFNANSFDREREVHKHVGDYLLFWTGMFPESVASRGGESAIWECEKQGRESYLIASSFVHQPYGAEAPLLSKLSAEFPAYRYGLNIVRNSLGGLAA